MNLKSPIGGFAPGEYECKCCICGNVFMGDKRSVECRPCAIGNTCKTRPNDIDWGVETIKDMYPDLRGKLLIAKNERVGTILSEYPSSPLFVFNGRMDMRE